VGSEVGVGEDDTIERLELRSFAKKLMSYRAVSVFEESGSDMGQVLFGMAAYQSMGGRGTHFLENKYISSAITRANA
jgi:hypothetical protein